MDIAKLLREMDQIECDMRRLEGRLTSIRRQLWEHIGGERGPVLMDGLTRKQHADNAVYISALEF